MDLPLFYRIEQHFEGAFIEGVPAAVRDQLALSGMMEKVTAGQSVAVAVGSHRMAHVVEVVASAVDCLKRFGLKPFVFPAMGTDGGATAEGQLAVLRDLGISEETVQAPIRAGMDAASLGQLDSGAEIFFSEMAMAADHVMVINRLRPHCDGEETIPLGLCSMLVTGCGNVEGAASVQRFGLAQTLMPAAELILSKASILCGLAVIENAAGQVHAVNFAYGDAFAATDQKRIRVAQRMLPQIPTNDLDVLVIDEIGTDICDAGVDPHVVGFSRHDDSPREPDYRTVVALDLTAASHGNTQGIDSVDLISQRILDLIDRRTLKSNATALATDRDVLVAAVQQAPNPAGIRMIRITNTKELQTFWASSALLPEFREQEQLTIDDSPLTLTFDGSGRLQPFPDG